MAQPIRARLSLTVLGDAFAICKLDRDAAIPAWAATQATTGDFFSLTRTSDELSIICRQALVPEGVQCSGGWRCLRVAGTMPFSIVGVLASLVTPLADAGISVFAIATFNTDYLLVQESDFDPAVAALRRHGHVVE